MPRLLSLLRLTLGPIALLVPSLAYAAEGETAAAWTTSDSALTAGVLVISLVLTSLWMHIAHHSLDGGEPKSAPEGSSPAFVVLGTVASTAVLTFIALRTSHGVAPFNGPYGMQTLLFTLIAFVGGGIYVHRRYPGLRSTVFAIGIATVMSLVLISFYRSFMGGTLGRNPVLMSLSFVSVCLLWRLLFGPWTVHTKATVLGTFILWVAIHRLSAESSTERIAHLLSISIAIIPAALWCMLFLDFQRQRRGLVLLMFFAGMLSTAPVLFYDMLVRRSVELEFFFFRIVPQNFTQASTAFVSGSAIAGNTVRTTLLATLLSFLFVGFIEEVSKFWVMRKSGQRFCSSIEDAIQYAIIVAIGFAFAENIINPSYFLAFVKQYLLAARGPDLIGFLGNVLGRSVLTTMVHILSAGVLGYAFGLMLFAGQYMRERMAKGAKYRLLHLASRALTIPVVDLFKLQMLIVGFAISVLLHGFFNFLVSMPDLLPGNPETIGDLLGMPTAPLIGNISLLMAPSLFYVLGGFWMLSSLLLKEESRRERGIPMPTERFVPENAVM